MMEETKALNRGPLNRGGGKAGKNSPIFDTSLQWCHVKAARISEAYCNNQRSEFGKFCGKCDAVFPKPALSIVVSRRKKVIEGDAICVTCGTKFRSYVRKMCHKCFIAARRALTDAGKCIVCKSGPIHAQSRCMACYSKTKWAKV